MLNVEAICVGSSFSLADQAPTRHSDFINTPEQTGKPWTSSRRSASGPHGLSLTMIRYPRLRRQQQHS